MGALYAAVVLSWVVGKVVEYRRSTGEHRQQLKWLMAGGAVSIAALLVTLTVNGSIAFVGVAALPISIGVGILKYRLYEIDRLISRTLSYAIVTGTLVVLFLALVVLTTRVLPFSSPVGVAASTLAAAALFTPLRRRVQRTVDRRFNRARYDAEATVEAFRQRLRDAVDLETVQTGAQRSRRRRSRANTPHRLAAEQRVTAINRWRYDAEAIVGSFARRLREAVDLETVQASLDEAVRGAVQPAHVAVWLNPGPVES